ncbi:uncharacterized protein LOC143846520 [Tasmannia lanceolata]|uniref:uncharacterized protein LOC143846520 n=1 Tax=Tasmannia lanceolata TaxID=3420 RepID=UPI004063CD12
MSPPLLLALFFLRILLVGSTAEQSAIKNLTDGASGMDSEELLGLFEVVSALLENPNWPQMHPHPCTDTPWPGIQCEVGQEEVPIFHVTKLHIGPDIANPVCKTSAKLSESLVRLPYLKTLSIFSCFIISTVTLPPSLFGTFSYLEQLVIKSNPSLSGEIPPSLAEVSTLKVLSLSQNSLQGRIPKEFGRLDSLMQLDLSYNDLSGEIPDEIGGLRSLTILDLSQNGLQGQVPYTLGQLQSLQKIDLSSNMIVGTIPPHIGILSMLVLLDLSNNLLSGPIPEALSDLKELEYFLVENNPINTRIPMFLGSLTKLTVLSLAGCGFSGPIPTSIGSLAHLITLSLDRNRLSGTVPPNLGALPNLSQLNLSQNLLSGELSFPEEFVNRLGKRLDVRGNSGLCTRQDQYKNLSLNLDTPPCLDSDKPSNRSWDQDSGTGTDYQRLKPSLYDGKGNSNASVVKQRLIFLWCFGSNLFVILMVFV